VRVCISCPEADLAKVRKAKAFAEHVRAQTGKSINI
jgi:hypothetical protein